MPNNKILTCLYIMQSRSDLRFEAKHPILLPKLSHISSLLVQEAHRKVGHMGRNAMIAHLRERFWIIGVNSLCKKVVSGCVICRKYNSKPLGQKMADYPTDRVTSGEPAFHRCGVDFMGPIEVKVKRSKVKRWVMLFTCLSSRAVHLEICTSLETDSCINAIRRFLCRRGQVKSIISDNGS